MQNSPKYRFFEEETYGYYTEDELYPKNEIGEDHNLYDFTIRILKKYESKIPNKENFNIEKATLRVLNYKLSSERDLLDFRIERLSRVKPKKEIIDPEILLIQIKSTLKLAISEHKKNLLKSKSIIKKKPSEDFTLWIEGIIKSLDTEFERQKSLTLVPTL